MSGFHGRYRRIDLSSGRDELIPLPESVTRRVLGGVGLGAWLLHHEAPAGVDPFAPEAALVFAFSPLVGTPLTTSAKYAVVARSPLTGFISDALSSSHFALAAKATGIDALVLVGRCAEPSELVQDSLRPTAHWGTSAEQAESALAAEGRVAAIGIAGENLVRYATISNDGRHAGRGGLGAVMGAKRLKAIVLGGDTPTPLFDAARVTELSNDLSRRSLGPATRKYRELGTVANLAAFNRIAALPTRNFQTSVFAGADQLAAEDLKPVREKARATCARCTIGCEHIYGFGRDQRTRIEYESLFALGPLLGIADPDAVLAAARLCDTHGLDTISAGGTIAFAMECGERGLLPGAPSFGDGEAVLELIDAIARRDGELGALLAEGSRRAALQIGAGSLAFAPQVKGMEIPGYEPRALQTMALGFAVSTRGADHNRSGAYEVDFSEQADRLHGDAGAGALAAETEDRAALIDSLILCKFLRGVFDDLFVETAELLAAVTGWDLTGEELRETARRIVALRKAYNIRAGWTPADDTLPDRFLDEALVEGASSGARLSRERLSEMIVGYNQARGWTDDGHLPDAVWTDLDL